MSQKSPPTTVQIARAIEQSLDYNHVGDNAQAWAVLVKAELLARAEKIVSASLMLAMAITSDYRQQAAAAVHYILQAVRADPVSPFVLRSRQIIADRVRNTFEAMDDSNTGLTILFGLLVDLGEADAPSMVKASRHIAAAGHLSEALDLAQRALALDPSDASVLNHLANILERQGRLDEACARRSQAARAPIVNMAMASA
jgi:tetratricopeptide (TPR) repeat protein